MGDFLDRSRRSVYRVTYPIPERPMLTVADDEFPVIDCSESGLRYEAPYSHNPPVGSTVLGVVSFRRGVDQPISGEVLRVQGMTVVLTLRDQGIPFGEIVAEQRYLRAEGYGLGDTA